MRGQSGKTKPTHLLTLERRQRILHLRQAGLTYRQISAAMWADPSWRGRLPPSYNERHAYADVTKALTRQRIEFDEAINAVRQIELDRLDRLMLGVWSRAQDGDDKAIASVLRIMERRAKYVPGLEISTPVAMPPIERTSTSATPIDSTEVATQLAQYGLYCQHHGHSLVTEPPMKKETEQS